MTISVGALSTRLREQTRVVHEQTETESFVVALMAGELPIEAYAALVAQNYAIYRALETPSWQGDPIAGPFALPELVRVPALEQDLLALLGPSWHRQAVLAWTPATLRYVEHLNTVCAQWPAGFVAHHYVRYLGDLSGGQIVRQRIAEHYGDPGRAASRFYVFDQIPKIKPFRDAYRVLLDSVPLEADEQALVVAEAVLAFEFNRAIFLDLGAQFGTAT